MSIEVFQHARVKNFINQLDKIEHSKTARAINYLAIYGYRLMEPYSKQIGQDLYEIRTKGRVEIRILYTFHHGSAYLLHAFYKKTNKIPQKEIDTAYKRIKKI